jgi:capsular exopolysaccharide synthesis family protein
LELNDYLKIVKQNWLTIVASALLGLLIAGAASLVVKPSYVAETKLFVAIQGSGSITELQQGNTFSQARVRSYVETVRTPAVLQPAIDRLGLDVTPAELQEKVSAGADLNTVIITISVDDPSPVSAAAIAQAVGTSLIEVVDTLERPSNEGLSPVKLSVVTPATAPVTPSAPNTRLYLLIGLIAGVALGVGGAVLRTAIDTRVRGEQDVRRLSQAPILGGIAYDNEATKNTLLTQVHPQSPRAESFRQIRTNLQFAHVGHESKAVLVSSSLPGEGKTTTATNLAIALAQAGQSVVLVDADLRRPRVDDYLGLERNAGLTTALVGAADVNDLLQPWGEDNLYVLTSGQIPPNPSELLGSEAMKQLIVGLESAFDAVIIDAPPLLPVTDAAVLAQQVGGVVLVIGSSKVKLPELERSLRALEMVDADLLGVVLNLLPSKGPDAYAYGYASYHISPGQPQSDVTRPARRLSNAQGSKTSARSASLYQESRSE